MGKHAKKVVSGDWNKEGLLSNKIIYIFIYNIYIFNSIYIYYSIYIYNSIYI